MFSERDRKWLCKKKMKANYKVRKIFAFRDYISDLRSSFPTSVAPFIDRGTSYSLVMAIHCTVQWGIEFRFSILSSASVSRGSFSFADYFLSISLSNKSFTFPFENRKNIAAIALSPDGNVLISVDEGGILVLSVCEVF